MAKCKGPDAEHLLQELNLQRYIDGEAKERIAAACREVINSQLEESADQRKQVERTLEFLEALWDKYDCREIAKIFREFANIDEALYGLERNPKEEQRYRDHFVHVFNCFVFGLRLASCTLGKQTEDDAKDFWRVDDEDLRKKGIPFSREYPYAERLFYMWVLTSTFHDIAIPFQHLSRIGKGVNRFTSKFGWEVSPQSVLMREFDSSQLYEYFQLLSRVHTGRADPSSDTRSPRKPSAASAYVAKIVERQLKIPPDVS